MQTDIPDDLKKPADLPYDLQGAIYSMQFNLDRLVDAVSRLQKAVRGEPKEEHWPYGTLIDVSFTDPRDGSEQWLRARVASTEPGFVKIEFVYEDEGSKMWVRRDQCERSFFDTHVSGEARKDTTYFPELTRVGIS
jgi:hypothetical protein